MINKHTHIRNVCVEWEEKGKFLGLKIHTQEICIKWYEEGANEMRKDGREENL